MAMNELLTVIVDLDDIYTPSVDLLDYLMSKEGYIQRKMRWDFDYFIEAEGMTELEALDRVKEIADELTEEVREHWKYAVVDPIIRTFDHICSAVFEEPYRPYAELIDTDKVMIVGTEENLRAVGEALLEVRNTVEPDKYEDLDDFMESNDYTLEEAMRELMRYLTLYREYNGLEDINTLFEEALYTYEPV